MQENLDREKKVCADVEKVKRKLETELKATQEAVEELDRIKKELEDTVRRSVTYFQLCSYVDVAVTLFSYSLAPLEIRAFTRLNV